MIELIVFTFAEERPGHPSIRPSMDRMRFATKPLDDASLVVGGRKAPAHYQSLTDGDERVQYRMMAVPRQTEPSVSRAGNFCDAQLAPSARPPLVRLISLTA